MKGTWILKGIGFFAAFVVIGGFAIMSLWNWLMPVIFGLKIITFVQALGLLVLSKILFGGFGGGHRFGGGCCGGGGHRQHFWKNKMAERWEKLSPEDREKFKSHWGAAPSDVKQDETK